MSWYCPYCRAELAAAPHCQECSEVVPDPIYRVIRRA